MTAVSPPAMNDFAPKADMMEDVETPATPRAHRFPPNTLTPVSSQLKLDVSAAIETDGPGPAVENTDSPPATPRVSAQNKRPLPDDADDQEELSMDMDDSDGDKSGSDRDVEGEDGDPSQRKKKGQRFFCTGYPPCNLSFTRSEHLARHIRKHTGERPFQCHCNRRFSRLDNLRQHAQTVHVNEEIPTDSLAATGTRFQRQIRTDRVRPPGRSRTNTMSSTGTHSRGHSRNLSASSIGSTSSNYSAATEVRRRPPPLLMANDHSPRPDLELDTPNTPPGQLRTFSITSPGGMHTPNSMSLCATPTSPNYGSSAGSPSANSPHGGFFGHRAPARRLSVPIAPPPFHPHSSSYGYSPASGGGPDSRNGLMSPTSSVFSSSSGHQYSATEDWRRRTWHPSTYSMPGFNYSRPATSGLMYSQTPDAPQPAHPQQAATAVGQAPRLPGIESFDHVRHHTSTPPRRQPSPVAMQVESRREGPTGPPYASTYQPGHRPGQMSWHGHPTQYPEPDNHTQANREVAQWGQQTSHEVQNVGAYQAGPPRRMEMGPPPPSGYHQNPQQVARDALEFQRQSSQPKRQGWAPGPFPAARTSPEDSSSSEGVPTPGTSVVDVHPLIVPSSGYMDHQHITGPSDVHPSTCLPSSDQIAPPFLGVSQHPRPSGLTDHISPNHNMNRLEALVAVATGGGSAVAAGRP